MIYLDIKFDDTTLKKPAELVMEKLGALLSANGFPVDACKGASLNAKSDGTNGCITYTTRVSFFRMLTEFIKEFKKHTKFNCFESIEVEKCGVLLDLSRNGVMKPEALTDYFTYMAMVGLNDVMLYMEDVYTLPDYKYFGYMRGRYTREEFKEIDDAADMFGIEVYPGVQMLSHMEGYLKTKESVPVRDTGRLLLMGADETYKLIDAMFRAFSGCFRSKRFHMGMDEAWNICKGEWLNTKEFPNGQRNKVLLEHIKKVVAMGHGYGYELEMFGSSIKCHCTQKDFEDFDEFKSVRVCFGSYDGDISEEEFLKNFHKGDGMVTKKGFLGGTQTWYGYAPENNFSLGNANNVMNYCKKYGVDFVQNTIWMNDGTECNHFLSLLGVTAYGEHMYNKIVTEEMIKEKFELITGSSFQAFMDMSLFHNKDMKSQGLYENEGWNFWGKKFLMQDIMVGLADANLYEMPMSEHYKMCREKFTAYKNRKDPFQLHYEYFENIFDVLELKCYIAERLKPAYENGDKEFLTLVADKLLPELKERVEKARASHREQWHKTYKAFGFENIDVRYSGVSGRCDSAMYRINQFLNGETDILEELEEVRLPFGNHYLYSYDAVVSQCSHWTGQI